MFLHDFLDSFDLCFVQEHWLRSDHLSTISHDFISVSVSGMDSGSLLCGRPLWWLCNLVQRVLRFMCSTYYLLF